MTTQLLMTIKSTTTEGVTYKIHTCEHHGVSYMSCTCPSWIHSGKGLPIHARRPCKHIRALVAQVSVAMGAEAVKAFKG